MGFSSGSFSSPGFGVSSQTFPVRIYDNVFRRKILPSAATLPFPEPAIKVLVSGSSTLPLEEG